MLFYNQIKREFTNASWRRGQLYFREQRVKNVRLNGNIIAAKVQGSDESAYDTAIVIARGTIFNSDCSCPAHRLYETHCKHVAALSIWVVERGSLLRAGIGDSDDGVAEGEASEQPTEQKIIKQERKTFSGDDYLVLHNIKDALTDARIRRLIQSNPVLQRSRFVLRRDHTAGFLLGKDPEGRSFSVPITLVEAVALEDYVVPEDVVETQKEPVRAEPVAFVRGIFQNKVLQAISVEAAARFIDPHSKEQQVEMLTHMVRQPEPRVWKNGAGYFLRLTQEYLPVLENVDAAKVVFQGQAALENLVKLLTHPQRKAIVFHPNLNVEYEDESLKLAKLSIGRKVEKHRALEYKYENKNVSFEANDLAELAAQGKLSSRFIWHGNKIYKLETSLNALTRFSNRSGVAGPENSKPMAATPNPHLTLEDDSAHPLHPLAAYRLSLELGVTDFEVDEEWTEFHDWRKKFEKKKIPVLAKTDFGFDLREYQQNGLAWMWSLYHRGLAALLADDMGLGKTHQVLAFLTTIYSAKRKPKEPSLVIAPTSVVAAWSQKLNKYDTHLKWHVFHGKGRVLPDSKVNLVLTTYGILQKEEALRARHWHSVILDEAQAIKNATTISSRASRSLKAHYRIAMTGTPVENQSTDLWSVMEFLLPGYLGSLPRFKRLYGSGREAPSNYQAEALKRLVSPFLLRRTKSQVLTELPEKTEEVIECEMTPQQKKTYRAFLNSQEATKVRENLESSGAKVDYASILALLTRLKQVCDHPRLVDITTGKIKKAKSLDPMDSGKWEAFQELVHEALGSNLKIVVFTQYLGMMDIIEHWLETENVKYAELRGDTPDRAKQLHEYANNPECRVFVCSLLAGGLGIDLTAGSVCIHYDRWWNPAKENQATDRLHRIGQTRGVQVFKLQIPGTIEDRIASIIESKKSLSGALIEESPQGLKSFSRKELLALLTDVGE